MSIEKVKAYLAPLGREKDVLEFPVSSATVALAAEALGVIPARIAKTISFHGGEDGAILIVAAGDAKVDNKRFKAQFGFKPRMLSPEEALTYTGHAVGGVCPFAIERVDVAIWLDESLRRFDTVFPACGSSNSAIELTCAELEQLSKASGWVDACKGWRDEEQE